MSTSKRLATTEHGPVLTITIEGHHDIYRITHALARAQCDFADLSRRIRRSHEKQLGPERMAQLDGYFNGKQMAGAARAPSPEHEATAASFNDYHATRTSG